MSIRASQASRPLCFFIVLALVVLVVPALLIQFCKTKIGDVENEVKNLLNNTHQEIQNGIVSTAKVFTPLNWSAKKLAKCLNAYLDGKELSFSKIQNTMAPLMFQAISTITNISQVSYIGVDGIFFSYYMKDNQELSAIYANSTIATNYTWYAQPVNQDTGKLYGTAVEYPPLIIYNKRWFKNMLNSTNGYTSVEAAWTDDEDHMFLNGIGIQGKGVVSLGFRANSLMNSLSEINSFNASLCVATKNGKVVGNGITGTQVVLVDGDLVSVYLVEQPGHPKSLIGTVSCQSKGGGSQVFKIRGEKYGFYCAPFQIVGVESVYVLALYDSEFEKGVHKDIVIGFVMFLIMCGAEFVAILWFVVMTWMAATKEMHLQSALIKEKETARDAERKSMKKSIALASASHDIRASLAGIKGLIEICRHQVRPKSELDSNLIQMESCSKDLLEILNSILDSSKIEAGKMQLQTEEFDIVELLEDVVDLFYSVGVKKGVDVMLDTCDNSITKFWRVKGDRGKLKQIISNLLSNAVKFTSEGYISVRAWAKEVSYQYPVLSSTTNNTVKCLSCLLFHKNGACNDVEIMNNVQRDPNCIEFTFEVTDTGRGIPKEKHKSVFDNFVQVKDTDCGPEGTGLGLGIVQSLVWLMGGEIKIMEKELGERGTCFRFNVFFVRSNNDEIERSVENVFIRENDVESQGGYISSDSYQHSTPHIRLRSPRTEGSHIVMYIQNEERCRIARTYIESRGVKVSAVTKCDQLSKTLKRIKGRILKRQSLLEVVVSRSNSSSRSKEVPLSSLEGTNEVPLPAVQKKNFILIVLDASGGPFRDLCRAVAEFRRDLCTDCNRVVWLDKPGANSIRHQGLDEHKLPPQDMIIMKPLHGSCLNQMLGLLPEFGGVMPTKTYQNGNIPSEQSSVSSKSSSVKNRKMKKSGEKQETGETKNKSKEFLSGKKVLLVEDTDVLRRIGVTLLKRFGATVDCCENGEEALGLVVNGLKDQKMHTASQSLPYDYILMDCQMPVMDGYEATKMIRREEEGYGVHIPIIALTAHAAGEGTEMIMEAGMDYHLSKPLQQNRLMEAIAHINDTRRQQ